MNKCATDVINLGTEIHKILKLDRSKYTPLQLGSSFEDYLYERGITYLRCVTKKLVSPIGAEEVLFLFSWAVKQGFTGVVTDAIPVVLGDASCTVKLISNVDVQDEQLRHNLPFYVLDATGCFKSFIVIDRVVSFCAGDGRALLQCIKNTGVPCILQAGYLFSGDFDYACETDDWELLNELTEKYEKYGFTDVNSIIGNYEDSVIMAYSKGLTCREDYEKLMIQNRAECTESNSTLKTIQAFNNN